MWLIYWLHEPQTAIFFLHSSFNSLLKETSKKCDFCHFKRWVIITFSRIFFFKFIFEHFIVLLGKFRSPYLGKAQQSQKQCYPFLSVCAVFSCVQAMVWLPVFGVFNVCADVDSCNCTWGLYRHCMRVCAGSLLGEKSRAILGTRTHDSIVTGFSVRCSTNGAILPKFMWFFVCWDLLHSSHYFFLLPPPLSPLPFLPSHLCRITCECSECLRGRIVLYKQSSISQSFLAHFHQTRRGSPQ